jgi:hypothetical protein
VNNPVVRLSNNQVIGFVEISRDASPLLLDQTNCEGLIHNPAFDDLRRLVHFFFLEIENHRQTIRHLLNTRSISHLPFVVRLSLAIRSWWLVPACSSTASAPSSAFRRMRRDRLLGRRPAFSHPLRRRLDGVLCSERLDPLGQIDARRSFLLLCHRQARLELVAQAAELCDVRFMREGLAEPRLGVAKLGPCDLQVLAKARAFVVVAVGPAPRRSGWRVAPGARARDCLVW